jgi:hypothetical protein
LLDVEFNDDLSRYRAGHDGAATSPATSAKASSFLDMSGMIGLLLHAFDSPVAAAPQASRSMSHGAEEI